MTFLAYRERADAQEFTFLDDSPSMLEFLKDGRFDTAAILVLYLSSLDELKEELAPYSNCSLLREFAFAGRDAATNIYDLFDKDSRSKPHRMDDHHKIFTMSGVLATHPPSGIRLDYWPCLIEAKLTGPTDNQKLRVVIICLSAGAVLDDTIRKATGMRTFPYPWYVFHKLLINLASAYSLYVDTAFAHLFDAGLNLAEEAHKTDQADFVSRALNLKKKIQYFGLACTAQAQLYGALRVSCREEKFANFSAEWGYLENCSRDYSVDSAEIQRSIELAIDLFAMQRSHKLDKAISNLTIVTIAIGLASLILVYWGMSFDNANRLGVKFDDPIIFAVTIIVLSIAAGLFAFLMGIWLSRRR